MDAPAQTVVDARRLPTEALRERGYRDDDQYDTLSVHHSHTLPG